MLYALLYLLLYALVLVCVIELVLWIVGLFIGVPLKIRQLLYAIAGVLVLLLPDPSPRRRDNLLLSDIATSLT